MDVCAVMKRNTGYLADEIAFESGQSLSGVVKALEEALVQGRVQKHKLPKSGYIFWSLN